MVKEFTIMGRPTARIQVLTLFPIPAGTKVGGVVPTPSTDLPVEIAGSLDAAEKALLDSGDLIFRILTLRPFEIEPPAELDSLGLPKKVYGAAEATALRGYTQTYDPEGRGDRLDSE